MKYNFDEIIDRSNNYAVKYDETKEKFGRDDLIPLWIADMDFKAADPIINALQERAMQGIYGYTSRPIEYFEAIKKLKFDERGLIPAIAQDVNTKEVLMLAYMNEESIRKTLEEKKACYFSRSRQELWTKGLTSGNIQKEEALYYDCDADSLLVLVKQTGVACHTGNYSCFFNPIMEK